jgi:hypothetical protein
VIAARATITLLVPERAPAEALRILQSAGALKRTAARVNRRTCRV